MSFNLLRRKESAGSKLQRRETTVKVEVGRFADGRLKMVKKYTRDDINFRMDDTGASIVPRSEEVKLERDVLEAINLWNIMKRHPEVKEEIMQVLERHEYSLEI